MSKKSVYAIGAVLLLLVAAGGAYYLHSKGSSPLADNGTAQAAVTAPDGTTLPPDSVTADDHVMGSAKAPVTMIEYFAQACSVCAAFDQNVFPLLKTKYIDTGKVRYVMRFYPLLGPVDAAAYKLDICVPPGQFFQSADLQFRNQPKWDSAEFREVTDPHAGLIQMARIMGLSAEQADACMNSKKYDDAINKVAQDADTRYQVGTTGTPTILLEYKRADISFSPGDTQGSWQRVQAAIDAALAAKGAK